MGQARSAGRGFSLVEVLALISVIGIMTSIAIPLLGYLGHSASESKAKRNAQNAAHISALLSAAGVEHVLPESLGGTEATTRLIQHGITVSDGPLSGAYFGMPSLTEDEVAPTAVYLEILIYESYLRMVFNEES